MVHQQVVDELAAKTPGKRSLAMQSFAKALRAIPSIISDNAGLDAAELLSQLRAAHTADNTTRMGVDVIAGKMGDMQQLGIFEAFKVWVVGASGAPPHVRHQYRSRGRCYCLQQRRQK